MKPPAEYHDSEFQKRILTEGSRDELIAWLMWNDPNGTYTDKDCEAEGISITTLELAREVMRMQIDPIRVIRDMSDEAVNQANVKGIDTLVKTQKYRHIVAWGKFLGFTPATVLEYVRQAEADNAPADVIQQIDGKWLRLEDIKNETNRHRVSELAGG